MKRTMAVGAALMSWVLASSGEAQHTGGSFGGGRSFGSRSSSGGSYRSSSSSYGGSNSSDRDRAEARRRDEERRREEARRREEEAQRRREAERIRAAEEARLNAERALPALVRGQSARFQNDPTQLAPLQWQFPTATPRSSGAAMWWGRVAAPSTFVRRRASSRNLFFYVGIGLAAGAVFMLSRAVWPKADAGRRRHRASGGAGAPRVRPEATLRVVTVAVDGRQRRRVQQQLASLAGRFDLSQPAAMQQCLVALEALLRGAGESVRYALSHHEFATVASAQSRLDQLSDGLRQRYVVETVREAMKTRGPEVVARREEGEGFVVVSLVTGYDGEVAAPANGRGDWRVALGALHPPRVDQWVALRVVWSPTDEGDRMSSAELETLYPELQRLDDGVGRVVCASCRAVGARELGQCPSCGAAYGEGGASHV